MELAELLLVLLAVALAVSSVLQEELPVELLELLESCVVDIAVLKGSLVFPTLCALAMCLLSCSSFTKACPLTVVVAPQIGHCSLGRVWGFWDRSLVLLLHKKELQLFPEACLPHVVVRVPPFRCSHVSSDPQKERGVMAILVIRVVVIQRG